VECIRVLSHTLKLYREQGDDLQVAVVLRELGWVNCQTGLCKEGIELEKEALEIFERLGTAAGQGDCLNLLASLLWSDEQFNAAEEAASLAINLSSEQGDQFQVCESHRVLGKIYRSKGEREKAIYHFEAVLGIASSFNWRDQLFWVHHALALLALDQNKLDDAQAHIERAKVHTDNDPYSLGYTMMLQAGFWYRRYRLEEAKSEVLRAVQVFEKLGAAEALERCSGYLQQLEQEINDPVALYFDGEILENVLLPTPTDSLSSQVLDGIILQVYSDVSFVSDVALGKSWPNTTSRASERISSSSSPRSSPHSGWRSLLFSYLELFFSMPVGFLYSSVPLFF